MEVAERWAELRREMEGYYAVYDPSQEQAIRREMDAFADSNPQVSAVLLKARLHEVIAERAQPVVFRHSPLFFELGLRQGRSWGLWGVGTWLLDRRRDLLDKSPERPGIRGYMDAGLSINGVVDHDHHSPGYTRVLRLGLGGIAEEAEARRQTARSGEELAFLEAVVRSCRAAIRVAHRFSERAADMTASEGDPEAQSRLRQLAAVALRVPEYPPSTFYEAIAALWFTREIVATFEGIGVSVLGHPDRVLGPFFEADIAHGRLTEDEARYLIGCFLLPTDVKFGIRKSTWSETSSTITLGGCDERGTEVFNDVTRLFLRAHGELKLLNPKLNCRFSADSSSGYLDALGAIVLSGRNTVAAYSDDTLIPAMVGMGKRVEDSRLYGAGGCQEPIVEGVEHSAGAFLYFGLPRLLELSLQPRGSTPAGELGFSSLLSSRDFEELYRGYLGNFRLAIEDLTALMARAGRRWPEVNPSPLLSATLVDCVARGQDYTAGGARYNPAGIAMCGFGTMVDSLAAIRDVVFEHQGATMDELGAALSANFVGHDQLLARLRAAPKFGRDRPKVDSLAGRLGRDLAQIVRACRNERGGGYQPSFFAYYAFVPLGKTTGATPDGRKAGEPLSQGVSPSRLARADNVCEVIASLSKVDLREYPANAVLDFQLPLASRDGMSPEVIAAVLRTFARQGGATIQFNVADRAELRKARERPEDYPDLVVRVCGFSAYFVALEPAVQDEIMARTEAAVV